MRSLAIAVLALGTVLTPAVAEPIAAARPDLNRFYPGEDYAQYRERYYYGRPYYGSGYYYRRHYSGGAVAAGVVGLAAGALIGSAIASQAQAAPPPPPATVDPQLAAYCARRFRSYDPVTGTFVAPTGERIVCTY
jgi:BA14K-like protein